jgi:ABC-type transport system substrate-binding protein
MASLDRFANFGFGGDDTGSLWADPLVVSDHKQGYTPGLALEWGPSDDFLTWTFTLREDVAFTTGNPFTSADVKATFDRLITDDKLVDAKFWAPYVETQTPDERTAVVVLNSVMPTFLDELGRVPIIDSVAFAEDPDGYFLKPSGTGAFAVDTFDAQTGNSTFTKNDGWWGWTDDNATNVSEIDYQFIAEDSTRASALQAGTADVATQISAETAETIKASNFTAEVVPFDRTFYVSYHYTDGSPFADPALREAFSLSIDRSSLVDGILAGYGKVATWPTPAGTLGYQEGEYAYDPDRAAELVADSDYDGSEIRMILPVAGFPRGNEISQAIQSMAAEAGFNVKVETLEQATFTDRRAAGDYEINLSSSGLTAGDPQNFVSSILADDVFATGYGDPEIQQLADSTKTIGDTDERSSVMTQVLQLEMDEFGPFVGLYDPVSIYGLAPGIEDLTIYADGSAEYKFASKK